MATKIVRDLGQKRSMTISIRDEDMVRPARKRANMLDISLAGKQKMVATRSDKPPGGSLSGKGGAKKDQGQVFFYRIEPEKEYRLDRINEVIRMAGAGILILLVINAVNIFQRGTVLKDDIIASASTGYENLIQGSEQATTQDYRLAQYSFNEATANFNLALQGIAFLQTNSGAFFAREKTVASVEALLQAAKSIAFAGVDFTRGIESLTELPTLFMKANMAPGGKVGTGVQGNGGIAGGAVAPTGSAVSAITGIPVSSAPPSLTDKLKEDLAYIEKATDEIKSADQNLSMVSLDILPPQFKDKLESARAKVKKLLTLLDSAQSKIPALLELLGDRYPHRYLILLQNDSEARPTGGFIGSIMIVDINDGYITKMEFHDVYEFDGQLDEPIAAPEDIARISANWRLRDANYSPDFAISGEKAAWFLQKEKGPSVDTVIAINQSVVADLLNVTGPITMEGLGAPMTKDNYLTVLSYVIESKLSGVENPKKILEQFVAAFRAKLFTSENWKKSLTVLIKASTQKSILMYSRNEIVESLFDDLGLSGRVTQPAPGSDYLNVITTSIGGNKSDLYINQSIQHNTLVNNTGLIMDEVTVKRKHMWGDQTYDQVKGTLKSFGFNDLPDWVADIMGRGINKSYVKIYVPPGSLLLDTAGIKQEAVVTRLDEKINKTYFMYEMDVAPGTENKITITYQLPQNLDMLPADTYRFFAQRQPGIRPSYFVKQVFFKPGLQSYGQYPQEFTKYENGNLYYDGELKKDLYLSAVVGG